MELTWTYYGGMLKQTLKQHRNLQLVDIRSGYLILEMVWENQKGSFAITR
jgi:hypothetical protein